MWNSSLLSALSVNPHTVSLSWPILKVSGVHHISQVWHAVVYMKLQIIGECIVSTGITRFWMHSETKRACLIVPHTAFAKATIWIVNFLPLEQIGCHWKLLQ